MPKPDLLTRIETALRDSVSAESFAEAGRLMPWYTLAAAHHLRAAPPGSPAALELLARVNTFFEWTQVRTNAFRACAVGEAARLQSVTRYGPQPDLPHISASA